MNPGLFDPLEIRGVTLRNRIGASPMCQYSCEGGFANDWHLVHLGGLARGGAGLVVAEATAVLGDGRISPDDLGLWDDAHIAPLKRVVQFIESQGAVAGIQIGHAGRKAAMPAPWKTGGLDPAVARGDWEIVAPSALPFAHGYGMPRELTDAEIRSLPGTFARAARRALDAEFRVVELHAAHGYLLNEFLSPLTNRRTDRWGGSFEGRARLLLDVARATREEIGPDVPLFTRVSATDWAEGGWDGDDTVQLARDLGRAGVDLVDCSTGGNVVAGDIPVGEGYQVPFAARVRNETPVMSAAVGLIDDPRYADALIRGGSADLVLLARALLRNPSWPQQAALALGQDPPYPPQYRWALQARPSVLASSMAAGGTAEDAPGAAGGTS